jgi:hypothetical protein
MCSLSLRRDEIRILEYSRIFPVVSTKFSLVVSCPRRRSQQNSRHSHRPGGRRRDEVISLVIVSAVMAHSSAPQKLSENKKTSVRLGED